MSIMVAGQNEGFKIEDKLLNLINNSNFKDIPAIIQRLFLTVSDNILESDYFKASKNVRKGLEKKTDLFFLKNDKLFNRLHFQIFKINFLNII